MAVKEPFLLAHESSKCFKFGLLLKATDLMEVGRQSLAKCSHANLSPENTAVCHTAASPGHSIS